MPTPESDREPTPAATAVTAPSPLPDGCATATFAALAARVARLEADNLRLRAAVMQRDSALAFARQDQAALAAAVPGLERRAALTRRVESLGERLQSVMREQQLDQRERRSAPPRRVAAQASS